MIIEFKGIPPSKKNSKNVIVRKGRPMVLPSKAYNKWHKEWAEEVKGFDKIEGGDLLFIYSFRIPLNKDGTVSKRPFDYSNKIESINDLLVDVGIIEDDNYTIISEQRVYGEFVQSGDGGVTVEIIPNNKNKNDG